MANRRLIILAAGITALLFLPVAVHAGAGGGPAAPGASGAGQATAYCCTATPPWELVVIGKDILRQDITAFKGHSCSVIEDPNQCLTGQVRKCRGEAYTPATGEVLRCFSP
jgi:hypothetical protein